ncbi:energy-coupling factor transporter transmembrane component T family protein [Aneurinibacillus migulanus]|uniref:energy-coupling factor transporter transmembrane component T family protein n=2 Tax=Aneurinibacillus migulanus TaxID=47500 RepID=UPI0006A0CF35|nr:energy-coupling factor transporter transmembrane component T [Aneurinibacillus migulanus]CEH28343.1 Cobalt transport protein [Aneurinibacillus migulanus]
MLPWKHAVEKACEKSQIGMTQLDPRTHVITLILASILATLASDALQVHLMVVLSVLYLFCNQLFRKAVHFFLSYIALMAALSILPDYSGSIIIILYTFARLIPMVMIGAALIHSAPSSIMCALERLSVPKPVLVMLCILIRFYPVLMMEIGAIRDGIRARSIFPRWYNALRHPVMAYECFFMPLIVRCLKLSVELASSAELRGIECSCVRTSIHPVGFKVVDCMIIGGYVLMGAAIYLAGGMAP